MSFKLKAKRVEKGIKQQELAKKIGVTPQYLWSIESGKTEPRRDFMKNVAEALDSTVQELFFED